MTSKKKTTIKALGLGLLVAGMMTMSLMPGASPAHAATTFTVNDSGDGKDFDLSDGLCDSNQFASDLQCTLRAAIEQANSTSGVDTINFNIPGSGVKTITPTGPLPPITEQVSIDGYSQPGSSPNTLEQGTNAVLKIELTGFDAGDVGTSFTRGLDVQASKTVIKGLVINRFSAIGVEVQKGVTGVSIEGNFLGTDPTGTQDLGNRAEGVRLSGSFTFVGGDTLETRNLISGNDAFGVLMHFPGSRNEVSGNLIGTKKDGATALGNTFDGVFISDSSNNVVGGDTAGAAANTIAFNGANGVRVNTFNGETANGNRVLRNSIFSNKGLGIDLNTDGVTPNDPKDPDTGANGLQNFPILTSAKTSKKGATIKGTLSSTPSASFTVQLFSNPSGEDEGQTFIGETSVSTDGKGNASFNFKPASKVAKGQNVTATAIDPVGNTSEFSAPKKVGSKKK